MARYFFHTMNGKADLDTVGVELPSMDKVRHEAIRAAGEMLSTGKQAWKGEAWRMTVTQEDQTIVFSASFAVDRHGF